VHVCVRVGNGLREYTHYTSILYEPHVTIIQVLWEMERKEMKLEKKQSFIDLGCGNGLLVYLLTMEGVSYCVEGPCMLKYARTYAYALTQTCNVYTSTHVHIQNMVCI